MRTEPLTKTGNNEWREFTLIHDHVWMSDAPPLNKNQLEQYALVVFTTMSYCHLFSNLIQLVQIRARVCKRFSKPRDRFQPPGYKGWWNRFLWTGSLASKKFKIQALANFYTTKNFVLKITMTKAYCYTCYFFIRCIAQKVQNCRVSKKCRVW
jgi:hypothetical protein